MSNITRGDTKTSFKTGLLGILTAGALTTSLSGCGAVLVASAIQSNTTAQKQIAQSQQYLTRNAKGIEEFYKFKSSMNISRTISVGRHLLDDNTMGSLYISDLANEGILFEGNSGLSFAVIPYHEIDTVTPKITLMEDFLNIEYTRSNGQRVSDAYRIPNGGIVTGLARHISSKRDEAKRLLRN